MTPYRLKKTLILALMIDALIVFIMQVFRTNAWFLICLYWFILTVKNTLDVGGV